MTLHKISENLDGGDIFFKTSSRIRKKDNINDSQCKIQKILCSCLKKNLNLENFSKLKRNKAGEKYGIWKKSHLTKIIFH